LEAVTLLKVIWVN